MSEHQTEWPEHEREAPPTPRALTREEFVKELNAVNQLMAADIIDLLNHDEAQRETIEHLIFERTRLERERDALQSTLVEREERIAQMEASQKPFRVTFTEKQLSDKEYMEGYVEDFHYEYSAELKRRVKAEAKRDAARLTITRLERERDEAVDKREGAYMRVDGLKAENERLRTDLAQYETIPIDNDGTPFAAASAWRAECNRLQATLAERDTRFEQLLDRLMCARSRRLTSRITIT